MSRNYLFGPVPPAFAELNLSRSRREGHCLAFDPEGKTDLEISAQDTWAKVCARFPSGWKPDFVALYLAYAHVPECLWSAPVPIVGLALDWPLLWHYYRRRLRSCDLVLTDAEGVERLAREGITQARVANLHGCDKSFVELGGHEDRESAGRQRDIDILFIGNVNPAVQPQRLPYLQRVASLGKRWKVAIRSGVFGDAYRRLLQRTRIVFSHVATPRSSRRHFEAPAAGALLFEHHSLQPVLSCYRDREDCVFYEDDNLEALLEHYLEREEERRKLVASARTKVAQFSFEELWQREVEQIETRWPALAERTRDRVAPAHGEALQVRMWQALHAPARPDRSLMRDLDAALAAEPKSAALHNAIGVLLPRMYPQQRTERIVADLAAHHFEEAVAHSPTHLVARLNLAEALTVAGDTQAAIEATRQALAVVQRTAELDPSTLDSSPFQFQFDDFRSSWERAAWSNAGRPRAEARAKQELLRWRLRSLSAKLTGDVVHYYEAALARPELPATAAALGCSLASKGYAVEAIDPLRRALGANPLDRDAARALGHMLSTLGERDAARQLAAERRLLSRASAALVPPEPWFSDPKPSEGDLASIIILCCNELACTRLCLESVLKHTRPPYELVLVDNGSTDETPGYLGHLRSRAGPVRVELIRNEKNVGFPAGCNQALAHARGRYLVFLNNDTIVTPQWLDGLIAWSVHDWPSVGLVGAVSNYAPDAQGIRPGCENLEDLDSFALHRREQFRGKFVEVRRLTGFCMLTRRDVLERVGGFDEQYGLGFFDDDDLGLRARDAGLRLLVALNVYIHHFGSRTFKRLGIGVREQLIKNFELFRDKWGQEATAGYRLPAAPPSSPAPDQSEPAASDAPIPSEKMELEPNQISPSPMATPKNLTVSSANSRQMKIPLQSDSHLFAPLNGVAEEIPIVEPEKRPLVSLCMIVKNEEARLGACLESAGDLFDEIIVVDTGSTDRTKEVASRFAARVGDFPWNDSFGDARNQCLRYATGKWIMWLDADDRIDRENRQKLKELFATLPDDMVAYSMRVRSIMDGAGTSFRLLDQVRMFPRHPEIRWSYRVHEQTLPAVNRLGGRVHWTDVVIDHVGYQDLSARRGKLERNLRLLELDHADKPDDAFTLFNLGWTLMDLGRLQEAQGHMQRSLELSFPDSSIVRKLYHLLSVVKRQLGHKEEARVVCQEGRRRFPDDTELLLEEALIFLDANEFPRAEMNLLQLVESTPAPYFGSSDDGVRGHRTRHLLGDHYLQQDRPTEAEVQFRAAVQDRPKFLPAWLAMGELCVKQHRWKALERVAQGLELEAGGLLEASILRARGHFVRKEFHAARSVLEDVLPGFPKALGPRVLLSHILLQENRDFVAAEKALREILHLDAANAEARHNLGVLLGRQGRSAEPATAA
jgi:GT2 family glycosyltransferase/Flp pilus assembly protein TadD